MRDSKISSVSSSVLVIRRKTRRKKTSAEIIRDLKQYEDPSYECDKVRNPLDFAKTSYTKGFSTKPLWPSTRLTPAHVASLLGGPTRLYQGDTEWVVRIPSREVLKVVASGRGVSIWGFNRTATVEAWVDRFLHA